MARKVLVGPSVMGPEPLARLAAEGFEVIPNPYGRKYARAELVALLKGVDGILAGLEPLDKEVLAGSTLKVVSRVGSGMSNVDTAAAKAFGIKVYSTPDGPTLAVAEMAVGNLLCLLRGVHLMNGDLHGRKWAKIVGGQLAGRVVAVIGFGRIGRRVASLLSALGARIIAVDPFLVDAPPGVQVMGLEKALEAADVVTLHSSGEERLIGAAELARTRKGVIVMNAARAGLLDEEALADSVESGHVAGAWLDVFSQEPYSGRLCALPQVILTPHTASYTAEGRLKMERDAVDNLLAGFGFPAP